MKLINIETAATQLGFQPPKGLKSEVRISLCINYLNQFNLTKVEIDEAFIDRHTGRINRHCYSEKEIQNILKQQQQQQQEDDS